MIGSPGWSAKLFRGFFGGVEFYGIPCGATEKDGVPRGRIIHDYGFYPSGSYSINAAHSSTSVRYITVKERVQLLEEVTWYIKADLAHGFRQFGTQPKDWRYQVYCNGSNEHYIDLACPFGKTNSTLEFCPPVALFAKSVATRYKPREHGSVAKLGSYVDDIFGGLTNDHSYDGAMKFWKHLCHTGIRLTLKFNMQRHKTPYPSRRQTILGCLYDSVHRRVCTAEKKRLKYTSRIIETLPLTSMPLKDLEKLHGYLNFAAQVAPYGRPFLSYLTEAMKTVSDAGMVQTTELMKMGLRI